MFTVDRIKENTKNPTLIECPVLYLGLHIAVSDALTRVLKGITYASFFRYVKVAMNAAQLAMASWKPVPVALV